MSDLQAPFPIPPSPIADKSGRITQPWLVFLQVLFQRTGAVQGLDITAIRTTANNALTAANAAQTTANAASTTANAASATAAAASSAAADAQAMAALGDEAPLSDDDDVFLPLMLADA